MTDQINELNEEISQSELYSEDLAPVPSHGRTWGTLDLAAIWVGMAVCIPTYILASYMIKSGITWYAALIIIGLANLIITVPMILNGHAGTKYGIPFPVIGRAAFGYKGIHIASIVRAIVACGWFGVQTWIGGLAFYAIWNVITGSVGSSGLDIGKFVGFGAFWLLNMYFIWKGTESIKWLEKFAAPILLLIGVLLIVWGANKAGSFSKVIQGGRQFQETTAQLSQENREWFISLNPVRDAGEQFKATHFQLQAGDEKLTDWLTLEQPGKSLALSKWVDTQKQSDLEATNKNLKVQFMTARQGEEAIYSSTIEIPWGTENTGAGLWSYILWLTAMVGFWATMSISIADITRYTSSQKQQMAGQFLGLPGTMILYSFVGIFVTFAAVINFQDILITEDAPWDPVTFLSKFDSPTVVLVSQLFMIIATLSTNIAANVIAPANAFSNLLPKQLSFKSGGTITGLIGIIICPWWLLNEISGILIFISGLLGPVLGILICDYYVIRNKTLNLADLFKKEGEYTFKQGFNPAAIWSLVIGVLLALVGYWVPVLAFLYSLSWFTGFLISFVIYYVLMRKKS